jgi:hypothetical protein
VRPTRETGDEPPLCVSSAEGTPLACLALLPLGVAWPQALPPAPVSSYLTFSPSPCAEGMGCLFLWPCSARHRARTLSGSVLYGVRTFLRRIESVRDHLMLFGGFIVALAMIHVKLIYNPHRGCH